MQHSAGWFELEKVTMDYSDKWNNLSGLEET